MFNAQVSLDNTMHTNTQYVYVYIYILYIKRDM